MTRADDACDRFAPGRLWSLWDIMEDLHLKLVAGVFSGLARIDILLSDLAAKPGKPDAKTVENIRDFILLPASVLAHNTGMEAYPVKNVERSFSADRHELKGRLLSLKEHMLEHLWKLKVLFIEQSKVKFYEEVKLFGEEVFKEFPSARMDIHELGKCWACGLNNAAVYHAIQAAEYGLRALAHDRQVVVHGGKKPIEYSQWGDLLQELEKEVDKIKTWKDKDRKAEAQQFYNSALANANALNDGYRTHIAHARAKKYADDETDALIGHVRRFLQKLSEKIGETRQTLIEWV